LSRCRGLSDTGSAVQRDGDKYRGDRLGSFVCWTGGDRYVYCLHDEWPAGSLEWLLDREWHEHRADRTLSRNTSDAVAGRRTPRRDEASGGMQAGCTALLCGMHEDSRRSMLAVVLLYPGGNVLVAGNLVSIRKSAGPSLRNATMVHPDAMGNGWPLPQ